MTKPKAKAIAIGKATIHALQLGAQVAEERAAQIEKWGTQRHPWTALGLESFHRDSAAFWRGECQRAGKRGQDSWDLIFLEEVHEALEELEEGDLPAARVELIQVMAVAAAIIEHIDEETRDKVDVVPFGSDTPVRTV